MWAIWICCERFEFDVSDLNLMRAIWIWCERFLICCQHLVLTWQLWATVPNWCFKPDGFWQTWSEAFAPSDLLNERCFKVLKKCQSKFDWLVFAILYIKGLKPNLNIQADSIRAELFVESSRQFHLCNIRPLLIILSVFIRPLAFSPQIRKSWVPRLRPALVINNQPAMEIYFDTALRGNLQHAQSFFSPPGLND